jgi:protein O-GlcNAc transferase
VKDFLEKRLESFGVSAERIRLMPPVAEWSEHLDFYNLLDIALDTTPWSSATTGFEALGMGVPLVALRGDRMASRMSSSLVKGLGHHKWVANSPEEAVNIVGDLGKSVSNLRENKKYLQEETLASILWDGIDLCKELEKAFAKMCC